MRAKSMIHHARESPKPMLSESGASGKEPARPGGNLDHIRERDQIVTRRAEAMEQHDDWAVPATMSV